MSEIPKTPKDTLNTPPINQERRRFIRGALLGAAAAVTGSLVDRQPVAAAEKRDRTVEGWSSEVRQTLALLQRPTATEEEKQIYYIFDAIFPFLISNDAVKTLMGEDLVIKCYVDGPESGTDQGDGILTDIKSRVIELVVISNQKQPNSSALSIRTSSSEVPRENSRDYGFKPESYPFDIEVQFNSGGALALVDGTVIPEEGYDNVLAEIVNMLYLELTRGRVISPPLIIPNTDLNTQDA
jgi:hypothetical protein